MAAARPVGVLREAACRVSPAGGARWLPRRMVGGTALAWLLLAGLPLRAESLHLVEHADTDATHVHGGARADNAGDILTFANPVFDAADHAQLGSDQGYCVRVVAGRAYECHFSILLSDGQMAVDGPFYDDRDSVLAIVGGAGRFAGARGEMRLHARDARGRAYDFVVDVRAGAVGK